MKKLLPAILCLPLLLNSCVSVRFKLFPPAICADAGPAELCLGFKSGTGIEVDNTK